MYAEEIFFLCGNLGDQALLYQNWVSKRPLLKDF